MNTKRAGRQVNPIRSARERLGLTQFQLAIKAGVHPATISIAERGAHASAITLQKLAKALGVRTKEIAS